MNLEGRYRAAWAAKNTNDTKYENTNTKFNRWHQLYQYSIQIGFPLTLSLVSSNVVKLVSSSGRVTSSFETGVSPTSYFAAPKLDGGAQINALVLRTKLSCCTKVALNACVGTYLAWKPHSLFVLFSPVYLWWYKPSKFLFKRYTDQALDQINPPKESSWGM